jgi:hypothetical protein
MTLQDLFRPSPGAPQTIVGRSRSQSMSTVPTAGLEEREVSHALAAMRRAAEMARKTAIQTDTAIIVSRDGKPLRITADELRRELANGASEMEENSTPQ